MQALDSQTNKISTVAALLFFAALVSGCITTETTNPDQPSTAIEDPVTPNPTDRPSTVLLSGLNQIVAGDNHNCTIKNRDSSLWCWGDSSSGQVGNSSTTDNSSPQKIGGFSDEWQLISGGTSHSCGIMTDPDDPTLNTLWCWGDNSSGQLGQGTLAAVLIPTLTALPDTDPPTLPAYLWWDVAAGNDHTCAIKKEAASSSKTLWCWGNNSNSQLAHVPADNTVPSQVGTATDWLQLSSGYRYSCGIREITSTNHQLFCWGVNDKGQGGRNSGGADLTTPQQENTVATDWAAITTGYSHACGLKTDNTLWCWGDNTYGQLGQNNTTSTSTPTPVTLPGGAPLWLDAAAGHHHTCAIRDDETLWCWGNNSAGQLGIGTTGHVAEPTMITHTTGWISVTAGEAHTCAIDKDNVGHCWGLNNQGQLGNGITLNAGGATIYDASTDWNSIASGRVHSCGIKTDQTLWCSGVNSYGQLGIGSTANQSAPVQVKASGGTVEFWSSVAVGHHHTCAIDTTNVLYCWGKNSLGQLDDNTTPNNLPQHWLPQKITVGSDNWLSVAAGAHNTCGIKNISELWCWGDNSTGQLGNGLTAGATTHTQVPGSWTGVAVGGFYAAGGHACAVNTSNQLWCWGDNTLSQLGYTPVDPINDPLTPHQVGTDVDWATIHAGNNHTCASKPDNTLWCWGDNSSGQTGTNNDVDAAIAAPTPVVQPGSLTGVTTSWTSILDFGLGENHGCAIDTTNSLYCWGDSSAQQATADTNAAILPKSVLGSSVTDWQSVALGETHSCGIREDVSNGNRQVYCWGEAAPFQFGDGEIWKELPQELPLQ